MALEAALIHRARMTGQQRSGTRNAQGAYDMAAFEGPWIPARLMIRGSVTPETSPALGASHVAQGYELLLGAEDENSNPVEPPTASAEFETDCPVLGSPTVKLNGEPEPLNNGDELLGYLAYADAPRDRS